MNTLVYVWKDGDEVFYVGIGNSKRVNRLHGRNKHCLNKRAKAERNNSFSVEILYSGLTWDDAAKIERQLISAYGRIDCSTGCLTNQTDGGEGAYGRRVSEETKNKISEANKGNKYSLGRKNSISHGEAISSSKKGKKRSKETKKKISESLKGENNPNFGKQKSSWFKKRLSKANGNKTITPDGEFDSATEAAKNYGVSTKTMTNWCKNNNKPEFYYA